MSRQPTDGCPYSGLTILSCKVSDLCDCFDFPGADARALEIVERRERRSEAKGERA